MAVTPESILESAAAMSQGGAEVDWRNATSRACYAAYPDTHSNPANANTDTIRAGDPAIMGV